MHELLLTEYIHHSTQDCHPGHQLTAQLQGDQDGGLVFMQEALVIGKQLPFSSSTTLQVTKKMTTTVYIKSLTQLFSLTSFALLAGMFDILEAYTMRTIGCAGFRDPSLNCPLELFISVVANRHFLTSNRTMA
jgi:hypothetical protein